MKDSTFNLLSYAIIGSLSLVAIIRIAANEYDPKRGGVRPLRALVLGIAASFFFMLYIVGTMSLLTSNRTTQGLICIGIGAIAAFVSIRPFRPLLKDPPTPSKANKPS